MNITARHVSRYQQIVRLLWKYGRSDLVKQLGVDEAVAADQQEKSTGKATADQLADDLEAMCPTFVKLGQVLSGRPDLIPEAYIQALTRLQDHVKPFSDAEAQRIIEDELGVRISKAFASFDPQPLAAASLAQVHRARLRDGREVVIKVQRPNIATQIADDFEVIAQIAGFLDGRPPAAARMGQGRHPGRDHRLGPGGRQAAGQRGWLRPPPHQARGPETPAAADRIPAMTA
jgi:predicted unusual protein kinase regulating ubiquinone biosynthesis (AarF/ABC1/UbiB family)